MNNAHIASDRDADDTFSVLYVDDDAANRALMRRIVALCPGATLLSASCGKSGVALAIKRHPNLVLLDYHLPDFDGDEALQRLRSHPRTAQIPVVILSGDAMQVQITRMLALGANAYITKPFRVQSILDTLDNYGSKMAQPAGPSRCVEQPA
jgi:CheY-like chemotaxis protein